MRIKKYQPTFSPDADKSRDVQQEIDNFLQALSSYPDSFAHNPRLSFEQHLFRIMECEAGEQRT
jgi:hypothetical protein